MLIGEGLPNTAESRSDSLAIELQQVMPTSPRTKNNLDNIFDFSEIILNEQ